MCCGVDPARHDPRGHLNVTLLDKQGDAKLTEHAPALANYEKVRAFTLYDRCKPATASVREIAGPAPGDGAAKVFGAGRLGTARLGLGRLRGAEHLITPMRLARSARPAATHNGSRFGEPKRCREPDNVFNACPRQLDLADALVLVSSVKSKRAHTAPARSLYTSAWFCKVRDLVEASGGRWFVLSARNSLVPPDTASQTVWPGAESYD